MITKALSIAPAKQLESAIPVHLVGLNKALPAPMAAIATAQGFNGQAGKMVVTPDGVCLGIGDGKDPLITGAAAMALPEGQYRLAGTMKGKKLEMALLGWAMGGYRFARYKSQKPVPQLLTAKSPEAERAITTAEAVHATRDLVNTPANDMGPEALEQAAREVAGLYKAKIKVTTGVDLLAKKMGLIHAVGRAAAEPPRLIDIVWGRAKDPKVTIVGKGVCFDSGGLDIKSAAGMGIMKKDMGGAANALGLARMIMQAKLKIRLRVLIPAVENAISAGAFRPGDVLQSYKGLTVEIGNTDAEGRLVLADAMALAAEENPDHLISLATLTGAARVALGPEVMPFYASDDKIATALSKAAKAVADPLWRMPFWDGYEGDLSSPIADLNNISGNGFAGSITAALFLRRFVPENVPYTHFDIFAWNPKNRPAHPKGGEAMAIRALVEFFRTRYG